MNQGQNEELESEAAAFFALAQAECRNGTLDFQEAALHTFDRDSRRSSHSKIATRFPS
jgi:hypothetical protein